MAFSFSKLLLSSLHGSDDSLYHPLVPDVVAPDSLIEMIVEKWYQHQPTVRHHSSNMLVNIYKTLKQDKESRVNLDNFCKINSQWVFGTSTATVDGLPCMVQPTLETLKQFVSSMLINTDPTAVEHVQWNDIKPDVVYNLLRKQIQVLQIPRSTLFTPFNDLDLHQRSQLYQALYLHVYGGPDSTYRSYIAYIASCQTEPVIKVVTVVPPACTTVPTDVDGKDTVQNIASLPASTFSVHPSYYQLHTEQQLLLPALDHYSDRPALQHSRPRVIRPPPSKRKTVKKADHVPVWLAHTRALVQPDEMDCSTIHTHTLDGAYSVRHALADPEPLLDTLVVDTPVHEVRPLRTVAEYVWRRQLTEEVDTFLPRGWYGTLIGRKNQVAPEHEKQLVSIEQVWSSQNDLAIHQITGGCWTVQAIAGILLQHQQTGVWHHLFRHVIRSYPTDAEQQRVVIQQLVLSACQLALCCLCPVSRHQLHEAIKAKGVSTAEEYRLVAGHEDTLSDRWWSDPLALYNLLHPMYISVSSHSNVVILGLPLQRSIDNWTAAFSKPCCYWWLSISLSSSSVWWLNSTQQRKLQLARKQYAIAIDNKRGGNNSNAPDWEAAHQAMALFVK